MARATTAKRAPVRSPAPSGERAAIQFPWSVAKLRRAGIALFGSCLPALMGSAAPALWLQGLCLAWLIAVACLLHVLQRRLRNAVVVLSVDRRGIFDRRLLSRPIGWEEIEGICHVDTQRSHVLDIKLRWPEVTLRQTRWAVRVGALCQQAYGVPAVSISMVLLEGQVGDLLAAIAAYRPDLLHAANRAGQAQAVLLPPV
jgi:hypothetical protein